MTEPLHLLRNFTGWPQAETIEEFEAWVQGLDDDTQLSSHTARPPRRTEELEGGSIYFCKKRLIQFRMPLVGIEKEEERKWAIVMRPDFIRVEPERIKFLRGWRYLKDMDAPADIGMPADMPADMDARMRELGVL